MTAELQWPGPCSDFTCPNCEAQGHRCDLEFIQRLRCWSCLHVFEIGTSLAVRDLGKLDVEDKTIKLTDEHHETHPLHPEKRLVWVVLDEAATCPRRKVVIPRGAVLEAAVWPEGAVVHIGSTTIELKHWHALEDSP